MLLGARGVVVVGIIVKIKIKICEYKYREQYIGCWVKNNLSSFKIEYILFK